MSSLTAAASRGHGKTVASRGSSLQLESRGSSRATTAAPSMAPTGAQQVSSMSSIPPARAATVIEFWREAGPERWFAKDPDFDQRFRECFSTWHEAAAHGELAGWAA